MTSITRTHIKDSDLELRDKRMMTHTSSMKQKIEIRSPKRSDTTTICDI